jgi:redox-sensitive bicupin YhaK (pirin superfamily)
MLELVINARQASISAGFDVRRIFPFRERRMEGPFIFMDHAGPVGLPKEQLSILDVLPHPYIGLSTGSCDIPQGHQKRGALRGQRAD